MLGVKSPQRCELQMLEAEKFIIVQRERAVRVKDLFKAISMKDKMSVLARIACLSFLSSRRNASTEVP